MAGTRTTRRARPRKKTAVLDDVNAEARCTAIVWEGTTAGARRHRRCLGGTHSRCSRTLPVARDEGKGEGACCFDRIGFWQRSLSAHARAIFEGPGGVGQEGLGERSLTVFAPREGRGRLLFLAGSVVCAGTTAGGGVGSSEGGKGGGEGGGETWKTSVAVASA